LYTIPKHRISPAYLLAAEHFDLPPLGFRQYFGEQTVLRAQLKPGEIVLDVCSGSGTSAIPAARAVGPGGRVIGLDLAPRLIALARQKAAAESLTNVEFRHADFDQAYFRNASFDAVVCVFGLFFFPDMRATVQKMRRLLRPGGRLAITTWGPNLFEPANDVFWSAIREVRPDLFKVSHQRDALSSPEGLRGIVGDARVEVEEREQPLQSPEDWWTIVMGSGHRGVVDQLTAEEREQVRAACLRVTTPSIRISVLYGLVSPSLPV
jgi:ubiquinone/menaquinone biosynthesis C-methylase UbiE